MRQQPGRDEAVRPISSGYPSLRRRSSVLPNKEVICNGRCLYRGDILGAPSTHGNIYAVAPPAIGSAGKTFGRRTPNGRATTAHSEEGGRRLWRVAQRNRSSGCGVRLLGSCTKAHHVPKTSPNVALCVAPTPRLPNRPSRPKVGALRRILRPVSFRDERFRLVCRRSGNHG